MADRLHPKHGNRAQRLRMLALLAGPLVMLAAWLSPAPAGMTLPAWWLSGLTAWMVIWWIRQAAPLPATALLPIPVMSGLGIAPVATVTAQYGNPLIFLFLGGFMIAAAMQCHGLHRRIALSIVAAMGAAPRRILLGFMLATAVLSMWISNTASTVMMFAVALPVIELIGARTSDGETARRFGVALMLSVAYSASIGGVGTLIGTPGNALLASVLSSSYGIELGFGRWMMIGVPVAVVMLAICYLLLTRALFHFGDLDAAGAEAVIAEERRALGPMRRPERRVAGVFALAAFGWMFRGVLGLPLDDAGIAIAAAIAVFVLPAGDGSGARLLDWRHTSTVPWGILLLLGGGLALAAGFERTGLANWIGGGFSGLAEVPLWVLVLAVAGVTLMITEVTSNTAVTATFLPILGAVATGMGLPVEWLMVPVALASSMAFMMPVATPPNAIVFGYEGLHMGDMIRAGIWLNLIATLVITAAMWLVARWALGL
ncbi:SLC13 family permease [Antarcticimicrobium sediminis]|uniref:DASS family sodium-coupled anion symporter n=1 Tax=Antarcticimicrobium sediminis TaxID=2546227 RepID=A0A4R5F0G9_9RHOB|nr:DASS family sodium-coupled anion symporter [Antarcticimicrobium sediminis]TDE40881.1 DASS family sodium-coupled anion symporter [Antarcticimicrobium sediminis]